MDCFCFCPHLNMFPNQPTNQPCHLILRASSLQSAATAACATAATAVQFVPRSLRAVFVRRPPSLSPSLPLTQPFLFLLLFPICIAVTATALPPSLSFLPLPKIPKAPIAEGPSLITTSGSGDTNCTKRKIHSVHTYIGSASPIGSPPRSWLSPSPHYSVVQKILECLNFAPSAHPLT